MFNLLLLIAWLFRVKQQNLSGSLWGLLDRQWMKNQRLVSHLFHKANADLKALDPMQEN